MGMSIFCLFELVMIHNKLAAKFNWLPKSKTADNLTPSHLILNAIVLCFCTAIDFSYLRYTHIYFNNSSLAFYPVGFDFLHLIVYLKLHFLYLKDCIPLHSENPTSSTQMDW